MRFGTSDLERLERLPSLAGGSDPVSAWLGLFGALSGLPKRERAEVVEELSDHLRERVRELMVRGLDEHEAVRAAIEELGGAAEMAARFRSVTTNSRRRLAMNLSMFGLAGAAAVLSLVAVMQPGAGSGGRVYTPPASALAAGPAAKVIDIGFADASLADVARFLGDAAGVPVIVHWSDLEGLGQNRLTIDAKRVTVAGAIALVVEACGDEFDYRLTDRALEFSTRVYFDRRETVLASYDLEGANQQGAAAEDVLRVLQNLVESDGWRDNGGNLATAYVLGGRMFVEAPPRFHDKIRWILGELAAGEQVGGAAKQPGEKEPGRVGMRRYPLANTVATDTADRLRAMVGNPEGLQILADATTNSLIVSGEPEAVEAGLVTGLDIAKNAEADGAEPVIVVIEYDGKREVLSVDRARLTTRAELLKDRRVGQRPLMLDYIINLETRPLELKADIAPTWLRDLPILDLQAR